MKTAEELRQTLKRIDGRGYPAYKELKGGYTFGSYTFGIAHVQGDPFASPSSVYVEVMHGQAGFPKDYYQTKENRIAMEDFLIRSIASELERLSFSSKGSGKSGMIAITRCGQEMLSRSACEVTDEKIIVRFFIGFPAKGRTIYAKELEHILFEILPVVVDKTLFYQRVEKKKLEEWIFLSEDQYELRRKMQEMDILSFVANGAILPRKSGISGIPLKNGKKFLSPQSMEVTFELPHKGKLSGMAIRKGITLIVGGGYHGKSTLLKAIEEGVYNHIPGDGREYVLTREDAWKLRAEDGRSVRDVDISMFIKDLPNKKDTVSFSTENASGSTSQAANVMEAMESGSSLLLIDDERVIIRTKLEKPSKIKGLALI